MDYLITKIALCLLLAFLLGVIIGWLMKRFNTRPREGAIAETAEMAPRVSQRTEEEQPPLQEQLDAQIEANKEAHDKLLDLAADMDLLKGRLEKVRREKEQLMHQVERLSEEKQGLKEEAFSLTADIKMVKKRLTQKLDDITRQLEETRQEKEALLARKALPAAHGMEENREDYPVDEIEGIGKGFKKRLQSLAITTTHQLLTKGATHEGRRAIAKDIGIQEFVVANWVGMADLLRVPGVDGQFAELLLASGIHSITDLTSQQAEALTRKMEEVNKREHRTPSNPTSQMVADWIKHVETLPSILE